MEIRNARAIRKHHMRMVRSVEWKMTQRVLNNK